jgi:hypothetical protein
MPAIETNTRKIIVRLEREGWQNVGGTPRRVQDVIADPHAEFDPADDESLVMIPLKLDTVVEMGE